MASGIGLFLIAVSVGLSNFAGAVALGVSRPNARTRLRIGIAFGLFEGAMPILGLALGHELAGVLGTSGRYVGGLILVATGGYTIREAAKTEEEEEQIGGLSWNRLLITALALSIDNLAVGFALGIYHVHFVVVGVVIAGVSVAMSLVGLELGNRLGERFSSRGEMIGGGVLVLVGIALAFGLLG